MKKEVDGVVVEAKSILTALKSLRQCVRITIV